MTSECRNGRQRIGIPSFQAATLDPNPVPARACRFKSGLRYLAVFLGFSRVFRAYLRPVRLTKLPAIHARFHARPREVGLNMAEKPSKPYATYPLYAHAKGSWAKKILGKVYYFGPWGDPQGALEK